MLNLLVLLLDFWVPEKPRNECPWVGGRAHLKTLVSANDDATARTAMLDIFGAANAECDYSTNATSNERDTEAPEPGSHANSRNGRGDHLLSAAGAPDTAASPCRTAAAGHPATSAA